ncbi:MAG: hypothetical protein J0M08_05920 [Bacteroidetes bacterium]|nr:hypothetical protein [Bacteroidota bacterium]
MRNLIYIGIILLAIACSKKTSAPAQLETKTETRSQAQVDVDRVSSKYPGYTVAALNEGKNLYEQNCGSCHGLVKPSDYTEEQWIKIVPGMAKKTNKKAGKEVVDANGQESILRYVVTVSTRPAGK